MSPNAARCSGVDCSGACFISNQMFSLFVNGYLTPQWSGFSLLLAVVASHLSVPNPFVPPLTAQHATCFNTSHLAQRLHHEMRCLHTGSVYTCLALALADRCRSCVECSSCRKYSETNRVEAVRRSTQCSVTATAELSGTLWLLWAHVCELLLTSNPRTLRDLPILLAFVC